MDGPPTTDDNEVAHSTVEQAMGRRAAEVIRNEAEHDFQTLFGQAFRAVCEQRLDRRRDDKKIHGD
jgi:adenine-specific DNA methylase